MTDSQRTKAMYILNSLTDKANISGLYFSSVIWVSPFGTVEYRVGFFEDYQEAIEFAVYLDNIYENSGMEYFLRLGNGGGMEDTKFSIGFNTLKTSKN